MAKRKKKSVRPLKTKTKRGSNKINFISSTGKDLEKLSKRITDAPNLTKKLYYYISKNKPVKGAGYKPPKAVVIIKTVTTREGVKKTFSEVSEPDFVVNTTNVKKLLKKQINSANDDFAEFYGDEPERVSNISLKFIY